MALLLAGVLLLAAAPARAQTLVEALADTYVANPTLLASRSELRAANEGVPQELSNWRPEVEVAGSVGRQHLDNKTDRFSDSGTTTPRDASISLVQPIYRGGRTVSGVARAENEVRAQRARLAAVEQDVLLDGVTAFMDVWRDEAVLRLEINNEQVLTRQLEASQDRFSVGEITRTDVAQSESRLARATADRIGAEGRLRSSRGVYEEVVGKPPGTLQAPAPLQGLPADLQQSIDQALDQNPSMLAAVWSERAAERNVRQVIGELLPEVQVTGSLSKQEEQNLTSGDSERARILAQVTVPLYQQGFVSSRVREAKQVQSQRLLEVEAARRDAQQQAISAWEAWQTARAQITSFEAEVESSAIALDGVRQENAVGARTVLDVLDAEQELLNARVNLVSAQRDEIVAGFQVLSSVGRLNAFELGLPVEIYDPEGDYQEVRDSWFSLTAPGAQ